MHNVPPPCQAADQMQRLYRLVVEKDATMLEINPLVEVEQDGTNRGIYLNG